MMTIKNYIGVDIGGTSINVGRIENGELVATAELPTGADRSQEQIVATLVEVIGKVANKETVAIGIGSPGYINEKDGKIICAINISALEGFPLCTYISDHFNVPAYLNNDANCFAMGESKFGAGKGYDRVIGITLGTGLGGGIVIGGKILSGYMCGAGELGMLAYKDGIVEDYCSSKYFTSEYASTGKELYDRAQSGDQDAQQAFTSLGENIGDLVAQLIYVLSPDAIIIGGSIAKSFSLFAPAIRERVNERVHVKMISEHVEILPASIQEIGIFGAAALCQ